MVSYSAVRLVFLLFTFGRFEMIAPVRPNNPDPPEKFQTVSQQEFEASQHLHRADQLMKSIGKKGPYDNLVFTIIFIIATSGALLLGKLISIIVKDLV